MDDMQEAPAPAEQSPTPEPVNEPEAKEPQADGTTDSEAKAEPKEKPRSRREALEKAFKHLADAPEGQKAEKPKVEARPETGTGPERGADGKFKARDETPAEKPKADLATPPARFSADAKAAWPTAPESVRAEAVRAMRELEHGLQQKDAQLAPLKPYMEMAQQHGTTVHEALQRYVNMETLLRRDPQRGLTEFAQNLGMTKQQLGQMLLGQQPGQADQRDTEIMALRRELAEIKQGFGTVQQTMQQQHESAVMNEVEQFASQHPRFDELSESIAEMLSTGFAKDLADAYEKAERLNPVLPAASESYNPAPAQTRTPKSVTGAPAAGSNPAQRRPSANRQEALSRAMRQVGLA